MNWDTYFENLLPHIASKSKDTTKTSAIIVGQSNEIRSTGYNGFPRGFDDNDEAKFLRPEKYLWTEHSERNAIYNGARMGTVLNDCIIYVSHFPCIDCARAIVQSGIKRVVLSDKNLEAFSDVNHKYYGDAERIQLLFNVCGIKLDIYEGSKIM